MMVTIFFKTFKISVIAMNHVKGGIVFALFFVCNGGLHILLILWLCI